jgi:taurine--2-oxoglutarate transaminase
MGTTSAQVIQDARDYTLFPWSVQGTVQPIHMTKAKGVWFWDGDGNKWIDFCSQIMNVNVGHQHPKVLEAIKRQVDELCYAGPTMVTTPKAELGKKLAEVTGLAKSFYCLSGTEANESAMKIARLVTGRNKIITRYRSYHGDTMGSMSASGDFRRWPAEPGVPGIVRVFDPYCYRCPFGGTVQTCNRECVSHIEEVIQMEGPQNIAAMLAEGITGTNACWCLRTTIGPRCGRSSIDTTSFLSMTRSWPASDVRAPGWPPSITGSNRIWSPAPRG